MGPARTPLARTPLGRTPLGRIPLALALLAALAALLAGCGKSDEETPVACLEGSAAYLKALAAAPGKVRLGGETPISDCLVRNQDAGELAEVGETMIEAATGLNAEAREDPGGQANLELGYLLGAAERGGADTEGIHAELLRRLAVAARFAPDKQPLTPSFLLTYRKGFDAGRESG